MLIASLLATALTASVLSSARFPTLQTSQEAPASLELTTDNFEAWGDFIRPSAEERKYEEIGWRNSFWPAVLEARDLGRPILLWTMNGHPLGCT